MSAQKLKVLFGSTTNVAGETVAQDTTNGYWQTAMTEFKNMDVVINVKTLTGTSPTMTFSVQELIDGTNVFLETGKSGAISATGVYALASLTLPNAAVTKTTGAFPMLGCGTTKQVVTTPGGTVGAVSADIYFIFYK